MVKEENESSREREDKEEIDFQNSIKDLVCVYTMSWKRDYFKLERFMQKQKTKMIWIIVVLRNVNKEELSPCERSKWAKRTCVASKEV
jgi:hypothetical protein